MSVYEYSPEEELLRDRLESELGRAQPSPAPHVSIAAHGRRIKRQRRRAVSAGTAVILAAAVPLGLLGSGTLRTPSASVPKSPTTHTATVRPFAYDMSHGLIGAGAVDGIAWSVKVSSDGGGTYSESIGGSPANEMGLVESGQDPTPSNPLLSVVSEGQNRYGNTGEGLYTTFGVVPDNIGHFVIAFANGESANVPVVTLSGRSFIAFAGTPSLAITRATAYDNAGIDLGYSIPFNGGITPAFVSWYRPNESPSTRSASVSIRGSLGSQKWTVALHEGAFGSCVSYAMPGSMLASSSTSDCVAPGKSLAEGLTYGIRSSNNSLPLVLAGVLTPDTARVVAVLADGQSVTLPVKRLSDAVLFADVLPAGNGLETMTSYAADGQILEHVHSPS
ncbi:hypothetical protein [Actinospica robiniae]|uniref:hypothetical protein n=1 Tax=Actinospica robiniae TaxID=304901 RepID=UPI00041DE664|nr:hypothetical protein [Actinospica robiniae]